MQLGMQANCGTHLLQMATFLLDSLTLAEVGNRFVFSPVMSPFIRHLPQMIQHRCCMWVGVCADAFHSVMLTAQRDGGSNKGMSMGEVTSTNNPIIIPVKPAISVVLLDRWAYWAPALIKITQCNTELKAGVGTVCPHYGLLIPCTAEYFIPLIYLCHTIGNDA